MKQSEYEHLLESISNTLDDARIYSLDRITVNVVQLDAVLETLNVHAALKRVQDAAQDVIDDWPDTLYGDGDPEIKHWVILRKLKDALLTAEEQPC